jgi:carboxypeptidase PM20D1
LKKAIVSIALVAIALIAVLAFRAGTVFQDVQVEPLAGIAEISVDREGAIKRFSAALTFPTISYDDRSIFDTDAFADFHRFLQSAYPLVHQHARRTVVNGHSLVYHLPGSDSSLDPVLFMSHMDVVPIEEISRDQWTHPPFSGVFEDGIIWGRGSMDDKIGVISLMEALELLLSENIRPQRSVYFAFGHDEEVGGQDGAVKIAEHFAREGIRFDYVLDEGGAVTKGLLAGIKRPIAVIGVSEKGFVNLVLTVNSPGGHSSQPPDHTAVGILSRAVMRVEDNPFPANLDYLNQTFDAIGYYAPFPVRLAMSNLWLLSTMVKKRMLSDKDSAAGIRTTTAATMFSGSPRRE